MGKNPFRQKPNQIAIENWGKTKFKPKRSGGGGDNKFNKNEQNFGNKNKSFNNKFGGRNNKGKGNFHNKEKYKFNQVAKDAKPENSTPWNKYKDEILFKQREEEQATLQANMNSSEAKEMLKQREINYRKLLIEQKKQEPTQWEDFNEEEQKNAKTSNNKKNFNNSKTKNSQAEFKPERRCFLPPEKLENFDSKKLSFKQKNFLRAVLTKHTVMAKGGTSLKKAVEIIKKRNMRKKNANKKVEH